ncbi:MAG: histidinol-phosphate aminotransferase [Clostridium sp.]
MKIINTREKVIPFLKELGFIVLDSKANFLFVRHNTINAKIIFNELRKNGILVRYFNKPRIDDFLRISIGTNEEMEVLILKLKEIILKQ